MYWRSIQTFTFTFKSEYAPTWVNYEIGCKIISSQQQLLGDIQVSYYVMKLLR